MNLTMPAYRDFVERYTQRYERVRRDIDAARRAEIGAVEVIGSDEMLEGGEAQIGGLSERDAGEGEMDEGLSEAERMRVSPRYQKALEAYLRAVSEEPPESGQPD
jgi:hypothetical protein